MSIIIVNYYTYALTCDCISSVIRHTLTLDYEIILIDNGSEAGEGAAFQKQFPGIRYFKSPTNGGFAKGNNLGIKNSEGKYILLLNSDTVLLNNAVGLAVEILRNDSSIGVVSGQLLFPDGAPQPVAGVFSTIPRMLSELLRLTRWYSPDKKRAFYLGTQWDYNTRVEPDWVWGAFFMFLRDDLKHFPSGHLHEDFFMYYEDVQWCYHFKNVLGKRVIYDPSPKVIHYTGKSDKEFGDLDEKYFLKMLPNEHRWMVKTKGAIYTSLYYLLKTLHYFSLRTEADFKKGKIFGKYILRSIQ